MDEQNRNYNQDGTENDNGYINTEAVNIDSEPQENSRRQKTMRLGINLPPQIQTDILHKTLPSRSQITAPILRVQAMLIRHSKTQIILSRLLQAVTINKRARKKAAKFWRRCSRLL